MKNKLFLYLISFMSFVYSCNEPLKRPDINAFQNVAKFRPVEIDDLRNSYFLLKDNNADGRIDAVYLESSPPVLRYYDSNQWSPDADDIQNQHVIRQLTAQEVDAFTQAVQATYKANYEHSLENYIRDSIKNSIK